MPTPSSCLSFPVPSKSLSLGKREAERLETEEEWREAGCCATKLARSPRLTHFPSFGFNFLVSEISVRGNDLVRVLSVRTAMTREARPAFPRGGPVLPATVRGRGS